MKDFRFLSATIIGLMAFAVTLLGYFLWFTSWPMMCVPGLLWVVFFMLLVRALKPG